jgi:outer membrane autotransporter protein
VLTSPRTGREISRSSVLVEQARLIAFADRPFEKSGVERRTLRHIERPLTSFRLGGVFSSLWGGLGRKTRASARLAGPVLVLCALRGFTSTQDASRRGARSLARAGCKSFPSRLLATIALFAASTVSTHAQSDWTGQFSSNWFLSGNWIGGFPRQTTDGNINTVTPNSTVIASPDAEARNLAIGENGTGMLVIQNGGTLIDFGAGFVGNLPGGQGTVTVTGMGSYWQNNGTLVVGGQGTGTVTIQDGGIVSSQSGASVGLAAGSTGTVTVNGPGSTWIDSPGGGLNIGSFGAGTLTVTNGGRVINITPTVANIGNGPGSQGMVTVTGADSTWSNLFGVNIGNRGTGTLTIADGAIVTAAGPIVIAASGGSVGTLNIDAGRGETTQDLIVGQSGVGMLAVQNGGALTDFGGFVGDLPGSQGTATVSGAGSTWTNTDTIQVGDLGTGTLTIENGGTVNSSGGGSIGLSAGSVGTVTVNGAGSTWNNSPGGGLNIGSFGTGTLTIENGGRVINNTAFAANIGNGAGSQGTVTVTGAGSTWSNSSGVNIGRLGAGTLTIADGGTVTGPGPIVIATNAGSIGTLNIGAGAGSPAVAPGTLTAPSVAFGAGTGTINFNHPSADYVFTSAISGNGTVNVLAGVTTLTAANSYSGATNVDGGSLRAGAQNAFSPNSAVVVASGGTLDLHGFSQAVSGLTNAGLVNMGTGTAPGTVLTTASYAGTGGTTAINTLLGGDGSPSDKLVINGGAGAGATTMHVTNAGGTGAETTGNGILVVEAINGATTTPGAFTLANGELRGGAFDYDLFRGGVSGSPHDWFLRSDFVAELPGEVVPPETSPPTTPLPPVTSLPSDPPPNPLPPGVAFPIIGPELATYGVVQPLARQLGLSILGTLDDRAGDTYEPDGCAVAPAVAPDSLPTRKGSAPVPCPLFSPSVWGRFFGQTIHNNYQAFADPSASGDLGGFQGGIDLLRGSLIAGQYERAGMYGAYGDVNADVNGLVTNPAATAYVLARTGSMNLDAWSAGGYWTHVGPGGWYLDAVLQGTWYYGSASTQFARLNTDGTGFIASLEGGYPFAWPQLGPGFVLEPQGQILWQKVSFRHDYDGLGDVALGDTTGPSGRIGLRTKWTIVTAGGQVWQPYLRTNLWRDWGAEADAVYSGTDVVPLVSQVTRLEVGGGLTGKINANVSVFANVDYEFAVGAAENEKQSGVRGAFGARYTW